MTRHCDRCGGRHYTKMCKAKPVPVPAVKKRRLVLGQRKGSHLSSARAGFSEEKKAQLREKAKERMRKSRAKLSKDKNKQAEVKAKGAVQKAKRRAMYSPEKRAGEGERVAVGCEAQGEGEDERFLLYTM